MLRRKRSGRAASAVQAVVWLVGLAILAWADAWWPGILLLVAVSAILEAVWPKSEPEPAGAEAPAAAPSVKPASPPPAKPAGSTPPETPIPAPAAPDPREDLLPAVCPKCGGPVAGNEVHWRGKNAAECPFCGAMLPLRPA